GRGLSRDHVRAGTSSTKADERCFTSISLTFHTWLTRCFFFIVKITYTFDEEGKEPCLTRLANPASITIVNRDPNNPIGIIDLKDCLLAIVSASYVDFFFSWNKFTDCASPELVANRGKDYAVYARDYTEEGVPLVGQGMLSWLLADVANLKVA